MFLVLSMFLKRFYFSFRSYTSYTPVASKKTGVFMADDLDVSEFGAMSTAGNPKSFHEFNPNLETTCMNLSSRFVEREEFKMGDAGAKRCSDAVLTQSVKVIWFYTYKRGQTDKTLATEATTLET